MLGFACFAASHTDTNEERGGAVRSVALVLLALVSTDALAQGCALTSGRTGNFQTLSNEAGVVAGDDARAEGSLPGHGGLRNPQAVARATLEACLNPTGR